MGNTQLVCASLSDKLVMVALAYHGFFRNSQVLWGPDSQSLGLVGQIEMSNWLIMAPGPITPPTKE